MTLYSNIEESHMNQACHRAKCTRGLHVGKAHKQGTARATRSEGYGYLGER